MQDELENKICALLRMKKTMIEYARMKLEENDWHGLCDSANDLRDIESEIKAYEDCKKLILKVPDGPIQGV